LHALSDQRFEDIYCLKQAQNVAGPSDCAMQGRDDGKEVDLAKPRRQQKPRTELKESRHDIQLAARLRAGIWPTTYDMSGRRESKVGQRQGIALA